MFRLRKKEDERNSFIIAFEMTNEVDFVINTIYQYVLYVGVGVSL